MNVFRRELAFLRGSFLVWTLTLSGLAILFLTLYPAFTNDVSASQHIIAGLPIAVRTGLGIAVASIFTFFGFLGYIFTYVVLCGSIQAMNLGLGMLSREDLSKTTDFLLSKPITRSKIYAAKLAAAMVTIIMTIAVFGLVLYVGALTIDTPDFDATTLWLMIVSLFCIQLFFLALGIVVSIIKKRIKSISPLSLGIVFGFFLIGVFGAIIGEEKIRYVTPFKFYNYSYIVFHNSYELKFLIINIVFVLSCLLLGWVLFKKRDIPSVI